MWFAPPVIDPEELDVLIVGAGISGIAMARQVPPLRRCASSQASGEFHAISISPAMSASFCRS